MQKVGLVFSIACLAALATPVQVAQADNSPTIKLNLAETLKKGINKRRLGYARPIRASGTVVATLKADLVTVSFGLKADGENVSDAVKALSKKREELVNAAKQQGIDVVRSALSSLNVRSRSISSYDASGNRVRKNVFKGSIALLLTLQSNEDILTIVGKLSDGKVSSINNMQFAFSETAWDQQVSGLREKAIAKARESALAQASEQNRQLKGVARSNVNTPRRRSRTHQQSVEISVTATMSYNVE